MANTRVITRNRFMSRRWEHTRFWVKEIARNPRRASNYEDDGMSEAEQQKMYEHFETLGMVLPTTRAGRNRMRMQTRKSMAERRTKAVHHDKFWSDLLERARCQIAKDDV